MGKITFQVLICFFFAVFFWGGGGDGGMPDMSHSFGCKATNWLRGISSSLKKTLRISVVILDVIFRCLKV